MITINYDGKIYDEELVRSYYDSNISERVSSDVETAQEFFEECRPLHRGCGLKSPPIVCLQAGREVALFTEGVD